ncbi:MAG: zinc ribbon domain-containing protein [Clostridia bacterium]|nr:zinc ribbon domain-containing protein [Clostridia bacterium]
MKCKSCGAEMSDNNKFCPACGADLREINQEADVATAEAAGEAAAAQPADAPADASADAAPVTAAAPATAAAPLPPQAGPFETAEPQFFDDDLAPFVTTGQWLLTLILLVVLPVAAYVAAAIIGNLVDNAVVLTVLPPVASFITFLILVLVWAFGGRANPSKRNFFRAYLLVILIMIVVTVVAALAFGSFIMAYFQQMGLADFNHILGTVISY